MRQKDEPPFRPRVTKREWLRASVIVLALCVCPPGMGAQTQHLTRISIPDKLMGVWLPTAFHHGDSLAEENDPEVMGGLLAVSDKLITSDLGYGIDSCEGPKLRYQHLTFGRLLESMMPVHQIVQDSITPSPFNLNLSDPTLLEVYRVSCSQGSLDSPGGTGTPDDDSNWIAILPDGQIAIRTGDYAAIAVLKRVSSNVTRTPSFDCSKASSPTEKAICAESDLWVYDRQVARFYNALLQRLKAKGRTAKLQAAQVSQRESLKKRLACGIEVDCLRKAMDARALELTTFDLPPLPKNLR